LTKRGKIGVINYGAGNLGSVMNALVRLGVEARFVGGPEELAPSGSPFDRIIFPGDGHFGTAMAALEKAGWAPAIRDWVAADKPFLGICIGLQLLFEHSEEAPGVSGLGIIPGEVRKFPAGALKVPEIGWNQTEHREGSALFRTIAQNDFFYYIHSFYAPADAEGAAAWADYGCRYCSAVERGALYAVQFHPEKSGKSGLTLLNNWLAPVTGGA
jgi:imidazole glycerol phosphate synthase glutamine amidotransferase subunit